MSVETLGQVADVDIDPAGVFKYILIKVYAAEVGGVEPEKMIVRGYKECPYHGKHIQVFLVKVSEKKSTFYLQLGLTTGYFLHTLCFFVNVYIMYMEVIFIFGGDATKKN